MVGLIAGFALLAGPSLAGESGAAPGGGATRDAGDCEGRQPATRLTFQAGPGDTTLR
ncbi:MAG: hypothetical protein H7236_15765 [Gemmatimonadaceae bacterium]|nr:hypothetical protein [Caulobacter sp.]